MQFFPYAPADTGWVPIASFAPGWSAAALGSFPAGAVRRVGRTVFLRGLFAKTSSWGSGETVCTLPAGFWPPSATQLPGNPISAYASGAGVVTTNGVGSGNFLLTGSYMLD